jgi:hypothetical protein
MKILNALAAGGTLLLIAAVPAAGQPMSLHASGAPIRLVAEGDFGAKKDEYVQRSKSEMREWQRKMHDAGETAEAKGHEASAATKSALHDAWAKTETESRKLETASADGWDSAKRSFEKASQNLKDTWHKIHPDDE